VTRSGVLLDVQATQSAAHRDRGVARYVAETAAAILRTRPEIAHTFLVNRELAPPGRVEPLVASGRLAFSDEADVRGAELLHVMSPFELDVPLDQLWPARAGLRRLPLAVTLYDTIPAVFPDRYLADPGLRARYQARAALVRAADVVLAISDATAADGVKHFQLREDRIVMVGAAPSSHFVRPVTREAALRAARLAVPGLAERFVLAPSGLDDRKNFEGLFRAWAKLPAAIRSQWQLVMVCSMDAPSRNHVEHLARGYGIAEELLLPGFVSDDALRLLYQSTELAVYPSLYEGFGLPVAEALACGAAMIGSDSSSVRELLVPEARFDASDDEEMARAIERGLTDDATRAALAAQAARPQPDWDDVATKTVAGYEQALRRSVARPRSRPLVAVITPVPPAPSGIADYTFDLLGPLAERADVHVFADGERWVDAVPAGVTRVPAGATLFPMEVFAREAYRLGGYDCVVACLGNSQFHAGALAVMRLQPCVVLAHEVRLTDLYALGVDEPGAVPGGFSAALHDMYGELLPDELATIGRIAPDAAERLGILMAREVVALSERFVVMSEFAEELLDADLPRADDDKIVRVPFAYPPPVPNATPAAARAPIVASFGVVNEVKRSSALVEMLPALRARIPGVHVAIVGRCGEQEREHLLGLADALGVTDHLTLATDVDDDEYRGWLDRAAVAVQLRRSSNGECSAAASDCLAAGAALVVSDVGANRELPAACAQRLAADISASDLGASVAQLLDDPARRSAMAEAGFAFVRTNSFVAAAAALFDGVIAPLAAGLGRPAVGSQTRPTPGR
jgi:glycosyltransferase involved in cell wall biosynthesis